MLRDSDFFASDLFDLSAAEDGKSILERARERVDALAAEFESPLPHNLQEKLRRYFHDARQKDA